MTSTEQQGGNSFDEAARREELLRRFTTLRPEEARRQIAILPYYHQLENEITKPNRGIFVTDYFLMRWAPALGTPAVNIVLALRKLANKDGHTFASLELIAHVAGVGRTTLTLWLSTSDDRWKDRRPQEREQWELLHRYFLRSKSRRYLIRQEGTQSRAKRTTNLYQVAMDDPVHPDDDGKLIALAAERILQDETEQARKTAENKNSPYSVAPRPNRTGKVVIREDSVGGTVKNSAYTVAPRPYEAGRSTTGLSVPYRINVPNVRESTADRTGPSAFSQDPRVQQLGPSDRRQKDAIAGEIADRLDTLAGGRGMPDDKNAGFYRRVAYLLPRQFIDESLTATRDAMDDERSGRKDIRRGPQAYFAGIVRQIAEREGIDLGVRWKAQKPAQTR